MTYSFIVAAYNIEIFIESCLNSLSKIKFSSVEFIVVDDGSTDNTGSIIDKFTFKDPRFKAFHKSNGGLISARKFGLQKATGEFVLFVDGDDYVIPTEFNKIAMQVELNKPDLVIFNYFKELNNKLSNVPLDVKELETNTNKNLVDLKNNELFLSTYLWNKVFSRKKLLYLYDSISNNITIGEDAAVTFPYYVDAKRIITIDCSFYVYRQHQFSMLKAQPNIEKDKLGFKELFNSLNQNLSNKYEKQILTFLILLITVRFGSTTINKSGKRDFLIKNLFNKAIYIYSTGTFGQKIYQFNTQFNFFKINGFIDEDHNESLKLGFSMVNIEEINEKTFDFVLIASLSKRYYNKISKKLLNFIPKSKILKFTPKILSAINLKEEIQIESN